MECGCFYLFASLSHNKVYLKQNKKAKQNKTSKQVCVALGASVGLGGGSATGFLFPERGLLFGVFGMKCMGSDYFAINQHEDLSKSVSFLVKERLEEFETLVLSIENCLWSGKALLAIGSCCFLPLLSPWMNAASLCLAKGSVAHSISYKAGKRGPSPFPGCRVGLRGSLGTTSGRGCAGVQSPDSFAALPLCSFPFPSTN